VALSWWAWALICFGILVASWMLLIFLAARLPEGSLEELAGVREVRWLPRRTASVAVWAAAADG
jgi:hypothetical protein